MYVPMKDILTHASENNYACIAACGVDLEMVRGLIAAADKKSPSYYHNGRDADGAHGNPSAYDPIDKNLGRSDAIADRGMP